MNVIFDVKKVICNSLQSAVWLEVFFVGCMDIEVLAIGLVIKPMFVLGQRSGWTWAENL